jgi:hypothetical protein
MNNPSGQAAPYPLLTPQAAWAMEIWHLLLIVVLLIAIHRVWPSVLPEAPNGAPATPAFTAEDLTAAGAPLAQHWKDALGKDPHDPLSAYLVSQAAASTSAAGLSEYKPSTPPSPGLRAAMVNDLNHALGDEKLPSKVDKAVTGRLLDPPNPAPKGEPLRWLNRSILVTAYPDSLKGSAAPAAPAPTGSDRATAPAPRESDLLLIVLLFGALGGAISAAWTTASFVGGRDMQSSWVLWHLLRPPIGAALAAVFYSVLRGGLVSKSSPDQINAFFIAGTAGLVGLFTTTAMQWLRDSFNNLPHPSKQPPAPAPVIGKLTPDTLSRTAADPTVQISGSGFVKESVVTVDGAPQPVVSSSPTEIKVNLAAEQRASTGKKPVVVTNPGPGNRTPSNARDLTITD